MMPLITYLSNFAIGKSLLSYLRRSYASDGLLAPCCSSSAMPQAHILTIQQCIVCIPENLLKTALQWRMLSTGTCTSMAGKQ